MLELERNCLRERARLEAAMDALNLLLPLLTGTRREALRNRLTACCRELLWLEHVLELCIACREGEERL